jgi:hypothetical protein
MNSVIKRPPTRTQIAVNLAIGAERAKQLKLGMAVQYEAGPGRLIVTAIRSEPWQLGHGQWVVCVEGVSGGVDCAKVKIL